MLKKLKNLLEKEDCQEEIEKLKEEIKKQLKARKEKIDFFFVLYNLS